MPTCQKCINNATPAAVVLAAVSGLRIFTNLQSCGTEMQFSSQSNYECFIFAVGMLMSGRSAKLNYAMICVRQFVFIAVITAGKLQ